MHRFPPALPHGELDEVFGDVFFVSGMMKTVLLNADWQFSRNMTVVRDGESLTLINSVRLDEHGLASLERLGHVTNVVRICALHGRDDAFYTARYGATFWSIPGVQHDHGLRSHKALTESGEMPFRGCSVFAFRTSKRPEAVIRVERAGGILVSGDTLQNWGAPDAFFSDASRETMTGMGFFRSTNIGPLWMHLNEPRPDDFARLREIEYRHVLPGHGQPVLDTANAAYSAAFERLFAV